ncbi:winged helix-turn-helix domain-containing protein [Budvicia aquatica]|uniref:Transcriptional regulatory protein, C terminal n=1 Tax=Budvicia aquatica TaxID=82979 RepID=A0A484ZHK5_9GAMM|nr:winged helix-turn-helix domain-containing protein [Budvicia aquatica]VFS46923.1 Transcriptional regulatory protein, C terminal [Budvicia aquatica]
MKYIINNTVIFVENEGLYFVHSTEVEIKLSSLSSRILCLLIKNKGQPVSRDVIYAFVWEDCGLVPSNTSLNNHLSFLRKAFRDCGIEEFIVTVPKVGISIHSDITIELIFDEEQPIKANEKTSKRKNIPYFFILLSVISLSLLSLSYKIYNQEPFSRLNDVGIIHGCHTYSSKKSSPNDVANLTIAANQYITEKNITCLDTHIFIIDLQDDGLSNQSNLRNSRAFYALCEIDNGTVYSCDNYYYLKGMK